MNNAGIYIHIPFCKIKCMYCDFYSITKRNQDIPNFVEILIKEINKKAENHTHDWIFDTIFFGGGTPSLLKPKWIKNILDTLHSCFNMSKIKEVTLETNPGEVNLDYLLELKKSGINRLSLGFQSLQPKLLKFLSRSHTPKDSLQTFDNARQAGFDNINIDLIFNIPGQDIKTWKKDVRQIITLNPEHISAYSLTVEPNTILYNQILNGNISMPSENIDLEMFESCQKYLHEHDYNQYEISNYAKNGMECKHNLHYWNLNPYLAFGPSAHGYDGKIRYWNISSLDSYVEKLKKNIDPLIGSEILSNKDRFNEIIINGIRSNNGIQLKKLNLLNRNPKELISAVKKWNNKLNITKKSIKLKKDEFKFADEIALDMLQGAP